MKWRCTWCGEPHDENDPPCDNCGHNAFEEAVVRADEDTRSAERAVDTGTTYVWACPNCGREHVKNNPPCSRCGNPDLEKTEQDYADVDRDLDVPSWAEVAKPYTPLFAIVGVVVVLFATGIISPSVLPGVGGPTAPDAPGEASESAGLDLAATERAVHDQLEAERAAAGDPSRTYDDGLAAYAEYLNRQLVLTRYSDENPGETPHPDEFDHECGGAEPAHVPLTMSDASLEVYDDETAFAADIADGLLSSEFGDDVRQGYDREGLDLHVAPDEVVYVMYSVC